MLEGVDLSVNNPQVDLAAAKAAGVSFTLLKLTEGVGYTDPDFQARWAQAASLGLIRGAYHFARPDYNSPYQEAQYYLSKLPTLLTGDIPALDMEYPWDTRLGAFDYASWALTWLQIVEKALGFPPMIYSYPDFILNRLTDPRLARYPLWLASYTSKVPSSMGVWSSVALWQASSTAHIGGIYGEVDEDLVARTPDQLRLLGKPAPVTPHAPTKYLVLVDMMARTAPSAGAAKQPVQMVYAGATLNGTGLVENGWVQVTAGGAQVWLLGSNLQAVG